MNKFTVIAASVMFALTGCALGPDFKTPEYNGAQDYMGVEASETTSEELSSWQQVYTEPALQHLITLALANNHNLEIARARLKEAGLNADIVAADRWPDAEIGAEATRKESGSGPENNFEARAYLNWQLDLFGENTRRTESAWAKYYAQQYAVIATKLALISEVAQTYFAYQLAQQKRYISENTIKIRERQLSIARLRKSGGVISGLEERQAEVELATAQVQIPALKQNALEAKNQLKLLIGDSDAEIIFSDAWLSQPLPEVLEAGLPSELLARRPDVQQAMHNWHANMANIGVAKAQLFPKLTISADIGSETDSLSDLFTNDAFVWLLGGDLLMPIFNMGKNLNALSAAEQQAYQASLTYERTVIAAIADVSNNISHYQSTQDALLAQKRLVDSSAQYFHLAELRYRNGVASSLDLMDAQRSLFSAKIALAEATYDRLESLTRLYRSLAGGWQQTEVN
ncbi:efflux transporter outer membrane subunit [Colwellia sp. MEBiC06753]